MATRTSPADWVGVDDAMVMTVVQVLSEQSRDTKSRRR